ncbi:MAG: MerB-like organometallic lyase SaoL [Actinomycetota bacterium]|nr:MAG: hypothetical protein FD171_2000 [Actinomycetota bacterium]MDO8950004.1 MerB-like organometallic lyase SaoL [Actinomycetota bacterium]MDP3630203.1 MerB-like organometallic lyase SaoL [Actinomycetota bacterium]
MTGRFTDYPEERLRISSIDSRCTPDERAMRFAIMNAIIDRGGIVHPDSVAGRLGVGTEVARSLTASLAEKNVVVAGDDGAIRVSYPVSAMPTAHRVSLADGRAFHAMCAIDALGSAFTFRQDIEVATSCHRCRTPIRVVVRDGEVVDVEPAGLHVVHADLNVQENWAGSC